MTKPLLREHDAQELVHLADVVDGITPHFRDYLYDLAERIAQVVELQSRISLYEHSADLVGEELKELAPRVKQRTFICADPEKELDRIIAGPSCESCGHSEDDHDGYCGMCDGLGWNASREVCGCQKFTPPKNEAK